MPSDVEDAKRVSTSDRRTLSATDLSVFLISRSLATMLVKPLPSALLLAEISLSWIKAPSPRARTRARTGTGPPPPRRGTAAFARAKTRRRKDAKRQHIAGGRPGPGAASTLPSGSDRKTRTVIYGVLRQA